MNTLGPWADYFLAQVSASAALTGLIFVVLAFNFDQIVGDIVWLGRAGAGLVLLAQPAIYGLIALFPTRTSRPVAWTLAAVALAATAVLAGIVLATTKSTPSGGPRNCLAACPLSWLAAWLPRLVAWPWPPGWTGGTFVLAAGALTSLAIGLVIAWFLLVEVRRATT